MTHSSPTRNQRPSWEKLAPHIVAAIESQLDSPIASVKSVSGGFSPGIAAVVQSESGRRAFVKAATADPNPNTPAFHRREILVNQSFPTNLNLPVPRMRWSLDEGREGWVVLMFDALDGTELSQPWDPGQLTMTTGAIRALAENLTPSPIDARVVGLASDWSLLRTNFWRLRDNRVDRLRLDDWTQRNLRKLAALNDLAPEAAHGDSLLHCDLRADNLVLADGRVYVVDWPHARIGAAWIDPLGMAPSVAMQGGADPEQFFQQSTLGKAMESMNVNAVLAAVAGYFTSSALEPEPPGLSGLREFQSAQGDAARAWLAARTGWK